MNSRNKLRNSGLLTLFLLTWLSTLTFAQPYNYSSGIFHIGLPAINLNWVAPNPIPHYSLFIEPGNGRYIKVPGPEFDQTIDGRHDAFDNAYSYGWNIPANAKAVVAVSGWYDTIRRPPRSLTFAASNPGGSFPPAQGYLTGKSRIRIDPCVNVILPGDKMSIALNYKPFSSPADKTLITFYYNRPFDGGNIFGVLNDQLTYPFYNPDMTTTNPVKAIRSKIYAQEGTTDVPAYTSIPNSLPQSLQSYLSSVFVNSGYSNALYFLVPQAVDGTEKNIFLTLDPTTNTSSYYPAPNPDASTSISASIFRYDNTGYSSPQTFPYPLGINLVSRDPNKITITPQCFENSFRGTFTNQPVRITVNFQNEGGGTAKDVETIVTIPDGLQIPATLSPVYLQTSASTRLISAQSPGAKEYYKIVGRKIYFVMDSINLSPFSNPRENWGIIRFTLQTSSQIRECMWFDLSISFRNRDGSLNSKVFRSALARVHCQTANFPCPR